MTLNLLANLLIIAGAVILAGSFLPVRRLMAQLPSGIVRRRWVTLTILIVFFLVGYLAYLIAFWNQHDSPRAMIVPVVFFFGAAFVFMTVNFAFQTALDIRQMTRLEHVSITDGLTGIYNRRYLDRRLEQELSRAHRYGMPLAVLLIDIDYFKQVNDTRGHTVGDLALQALSNQLLREIRESDILARYGGDELLLIAPNTNLDAARAVAERLRNRIAQQPVTFTGKNRPEFALSLTISIGVAELQGTEEGPLEVIDHADVALYQAKSAGRNRVEVYRAVNAGQLA